MRTNKIAYTMTFSNLIPNKLFALILGVMDKTNQDQGTNVCVVIN